MNIPGHFQPLALPTHQHRVTPPLKQVRAPLVPVIEPPAGVTDEPRPRGFNQTGENFNYEDVTLHSSSHQLFGPLFNGRYQALVVEGNGSGYLKPRRGWCLGAESFRPELLGQMSEIVAAGIGDDPQRFYRLRENR